MRKLIGSLKMLIMFIRITILKLLKRENFIENQAPLILMG